MVKKSAYEENREKRMVENKIRMEQLNLNKLAQALHKPNISSSPMKKKVVKPRVSKQPVDPSSIRRSRRVADKPPVVYKEVHFEVTERRRRYGTGSTRRDLSDWVYASSEDKAYAIQKAEDLESTLDQNLPSFVKPMLHSHVYNGFWLGLPSHFKEHLPKRDEGMSLVDEEGEETIAKYLFRKNGLSGGWGTFAREHDLVDGDALVFQLVKPTEFKVYIIRVNELRESDN